MKALLVADDEKAINNISEVLKAAGYDTIVYKWLLKALDNIEEVAPHLIIVSTGDYPRHWKTLAQYATAGFGDYKPQIILYTDENFSEEEHKKAEALHVRGTFDSVTVEGLDKLREILKKSDDIFSGYLTEEESEELEEAEELLEESEIESPIEEEDFDELANKVEAAEPLGEVNSEDSFDELSSKVEAAEPLGEVNTEDSFDELSSKVEATEPLGEVNSEDSFDELSSKVEATEPLGEVSEEDNFEDLSNMVEEANDAEEEALADEEAASRLEEIENDELAANRLEEMSGDDLAADRLEEIAEDEKAADKLTRLSDNEEIPTVQSILNEPYDESESTALPGIEELKELLDENNFEESENNDIIEDTEEISEEDSENQKGETNMADEQSIEDKLAEIMNANKADQKEKAEALKLDTTTSSVSFVFTNPITLAMVSGVARNYNGLVLEFTPDIPTFIMNLSPGTKIDIASMKIDDKIENVFAEVMSNDAKKLALAIKKIS